jgi:hypothetical protein
MEFDPHTRLAGECLQPLGHLSLRSAWQFRGWRAARERTASARPGETRAEPLPVGLRNAGALALRYSAQTNGYALLLSDAYPYTGPARRSRDPRADATSEL